MRRKTYSKWIHISLCVRAFYNGRLCRFFRRLNRKTKIKFHFRQNFLAAGFGRNFRRARMCKITVSCSNISRTVLRQECTLTSFWSRGRRESKYCDSLPRKKVVIYFQIDTKVWDVFPITTQMLLLFPNLYR